MAQWKWTLGWFREANTDEALCTMTSLYLFLKFRQAFDIVNETLLVHCPN